MQCAPARTYVRDTVSKDNVENVTHPAALAIATEVGTASKHPLLSAKSCCLSPRLSHRQRRHLVLKSRCAVVSMSSSGLVLLKGASHCGWLQRFTSVWVLQKLITLQDNAMQKKSHIPVRRPSARLRSLEATQCCMQSQTQVLRQM
jgi:hypothetical protein